MTDPATEDSPGPLRRFLDHPWVRRLETVLFIALLAFVLYRLAPQLSAWTGIGPVVGEAPEFTVVTLEGDTIRSADLAGRPVVVNFWATWCPPCRLEMPALQDLHEEHGGKEGLVMLGISTDAGGSGTVESFLRERGITYPVAMADPGIRRAFGGISAIPTTFLIDRQGVIRHRVFGFFAPPALKAAVRRIMTEGVSGGVSGSAPESTIVRNPGPWNGSMSPPLSAGRASVR